MELPKELSNMFDRISMSYKMVFTLALLEEVNKDGVAAYDMVVDRYVLYYQKRYHDGLQVETFKPELYDKPFGKINWNEFKRSIRYPIGSVPFQNILEERSGVIGFKPEIWRIMTPDIIETLKHVARDKLRAYYDQPRNTVSSTMKQRMVNADYKGEQLDKQVFMELYDFDIPVIINAVGDYIFANGFTFPQHLIGNFYLSLKSKPFVILAGISGTGKTKLIKLFAEALGATEQNGRFNLIPVRPDWSDPSDLIGYTDLNGIFREGELTKVLQRAMANPHEPYFICLDEMNLARVEHYFSDLLSILEMQQWDADRERIITHKVVSLPPERYEQLGVDHDEEVTYLTDLHLPDNLYLIGTVNMDETTHPFSKKVLDRANTIEFNYIDLEDLDWLDADGSDSAQALENIPNSFLRSDYLNLKDAAEHRDLIKDVSAKLAQINKILERIHANVGFRVRDAICFYMSYNKRFDLLPDDTAFDFQIMQKILPRIQGSSHAVRNVLIDLLNYLPLEVGLIIATENWGDESSDLMKIVHKWTHDDFDQKMRYPESARKIAFMLRRYDEDGFTSFWLS